MQTILIFDLADVLIEGFHSFVEVLSKRLSLPATEVISGVGVHPWSLSQKGGYPKQPIGSAF